ncbi:serine/threonine protein kinase, partial [Streptomyces puniciscabiei]
TGGGPRGNGTGAPARPGSARPTPPPRGDRRSGNGTRPAQRNGSGRPVQRTTGTRLRPANPRLLRQRLFVFVVVTLLVALGIAVAQGCQGPARGLGDDAGRHQRLAQPSHPPAVAARPVSDRYGPTQGQGLDT